MPDTIDEYTCSEIAKLIHEMTNKRYKNIKKDQLLQLHQICENSESHIKRIYTLLIDNLKKPHSEIRFNSFYIFAKFFKKYPRFRDIAVEDMKNILNLVVDVNWETKLPPPKTAANELKRYFLVCLKNWVQEYGLTYYKLKLCYEFLRLKKHVNFEELELEDHATRRRKEQEKLKKQRFDEEKLSNLRNEIKDSKSEIKAACDSLKTCLAMLVPTPEEFSFHEDETLPSTSSGISNLSETDVGFRETGILLGNVSVGINLSKDQDFLEIVENDENSIIVENAKDHYKLLEKKYVNLVKNWIKQLSSLSGAPSELKEIIDLKNDIEYLLKKYSKLSFKKILEENDESDDDMVEVILENTTADDKLIAQFKNIDNVEPSTSKTEDGSSDQIDFVVDEKVERKKKLLELAPKLPFDVDLYHWEEENPSVPLLQPVTAEGRNFWLATAMEDSDGIPNPEGAASLRVRTIEFTGEFKPVKWSCRFPLPGGKLCPRKDRVKCPFHGTIVARDENGKCIDPENRKKDEKLLSKLSEMETQDPEILVQIKMATGIDLKRPEKGKRRRKNDDSELTDIRKEENTVYKRLEKKIFKRSTVKKVARTLDALDQKRYRDKYGDQFQYVHETT